MTALAVYRLEECVIAAPFLRETVFRDGYRLLLLPGADPGPAKPAPATLSP